MRQVLVIQHVHCEELAEIGAVLQAAGVGWRYCRAFAGEAVPEAPTDWQGLVLLGGPMSVYDTAEYPFLLAEQRLLEATLAAGLPILGVCLGSQLLAAVLGAEVRAGGLKELGWHPLHLGPGAAEDPLFGELPGEFMAFHWHGDVFDPPAGAVPLASSPITPCQVFRYGEAWGTLCHLEVDEPAVHRLVESFRDEWQAAGLTESAILEPLPRYLPRLRRCGHQVYRAWAARLPEA